MLNALQTGLFSADPDTAKAAANASLTLAIPDAIPVLDLLSEAYEFWKKHEAPYPAESGVVPSSPRQALLKAILNIQAASAAELFEYVSDTRSDVKETATTKLHEALAESDEIREMFVARIEAGTLSSGLIASALAAKTPFAAGQILQITKLLLHPNPQLRFDVLKMLDEYYMTSAEIHRYANILKTDAALQIRDAAYRLLDVVTSPRA